MGWPRTLVCLVLVFVMSSPLAMPQQDTIADAVGAGDGYETDPAVQGLVQALLLGESIPLLLGTTLSSVEATEATYYSVDVQNPDGSMRSVDVAEATLQGDGLTMGLAMRIGDDYSLFASNDVDTVWKGTFLQLAPPSELPPVQPTTVPPPTQSTNDGTNPCGELGVLECLTQLLCGDDSNPDTCFEGSRDRCQFPDFDETVWPYAACVWDDAMSTTPAVNPCRWEGQWINEHENLNSPIQCLKDAGFAELPGMLMCDPSQECSADLDQGQTGALVSFDTTIIIDDAWASHWFPAETAAINIQAQASAAMVLSAHIAAPATKVLLASVVAPGINTASTCWGAIQVVRDLDALSAGQITGIYSGRFLGDYGCSNGYHIANGPTEAVFHISDADTSPFLIKLAMHETGHLFGPDHQPVGDYVDIIDGIQTAMGDAHEDFMLRYSWYRTNSLGDPVYEKPWLEYNRNRARFCVEELPSCRGIHDPMI